MIAASTGTSRAAQAIRVAESVPALVVVTDRGHGIRERGDPGDDLGAPGGVLAHDGSLGAVEPVRLREDRVGHPDLPDVVEERGGPEGAEPPRRQA